VLIVGAFCGTSVNHAGIVPGDVITSVDGHTVTTPDSLSSLTGSYHPGAVVQIGWEDESGGRHTTEITLGNGPVR
jgi:S1-C subfamily serine protease